MIQLPLLEDLKSLQDLIGDIHLAIDQTGRLVFGEKIKVAGFESGSSFLQLMSDSIPVVTFIGMLISTYLDIRKKQLEVQEQLRKLQEIGAEELEIEPVKIRLEVTVKMAYEKGAEKLAHDAIDLMETKDEKQRIRESTHEIRQTALVGLEKLNKLWEQGAVFQPTLNARPEIKKLLPGPVGKVPSDAKLLMSSSMVDRAKSKS